MAEVELGFGISSSNNRRSSQRGVLARSYNMVLEVEGSLVILMKSILDSPHESGNHGRGLVDFVSLSNFI